MCCESSKSFVRLLVWNRIPRKDEDAEKCEWLGGHVTLQVEYNGDSAQIGWWPGHWSLASSEDKRSGWLAKQYRDWISYHDGKRTRYARQSEMPSESDPELFDSFMVRGRQDTTLSTTSGKEALPSTTYYLCIKDIEKVLTYVKKFNTGTCRYHALRNNCATVAAKALRAGGARIPKLPIISPRILSSFCKRRLVCSASK